ncbi:hypothetical protein BJX63DRAFT_384051 [Aspergillus granulosus]|uniref:Uncharacterized protein n=1 Tax=Aspergillus granulosus TaxID=176169 RepID=A0ABR4HS71_9EURO
MSNSLRCKQSSGDLQRFFSKFLSITARHWLVSFWCIAFSSIQNFVLSSVFLVDSSRRKSRKDRCRSLTGVSRLSGTIRTE